MQLNILLVEDEPGIRDGLASFLRLKGMRVTTAGSRSEGLLAMAHDDHDVVVTDWRLGDGLGADIVTASEAPVVIASGVPEEVEVPASERGICVVRKPVAPADLVERIEELAASTASDRCLEEDSALPVDARDRVQLLLALAGSPQPTQIIDDGSFVTLEAHLTSEQEDQVLASMPVLERICGDIRVLGNGVPILQARFYRDSREDEATCVVSPSGIWPQDVTSLAVDFDHPCSPVRFQELVRQARESEQKGRSVAFLNVPGHLRLLVEVLGEPHDMPTRGRAGPRLPEVLTELWR